jgi:PIN domain nuclease of toxin-antitoxin system
LRALLDTQSVLWWFTEARYLSGAARAAIADRANTILVSVVSAFELGIKHRLGKLPAAAPLLASFPQALAGAGFLGLDVNLEHALRAGRLLPPHRDPFDRLLMAQALVEDLVLVTSDRAIRGSGVPTLW